MGRPWLTCIAVLVVLGGCSAPETEPPTPVETAGLENGSYTATLNGFEIHYEIHGSGPIRMTVPNSWGLSLDGLRALYRPLEEDLTLVYFDPRGMGRSEDIREEADMGLAAVRRDFQALREYLRLDAVHAIGWSNGASNLVLLAHEHPATLESAIFVHGVASFTQEDMERFATDYPELTARWMEVDEALRSEALDNAQRTERMKSFWLTEYFPIALADSEVHADAVRRAFEPAELDWSYADYSNRESPTFDARDRLPEIPVRSLVIAGTHDMLPPDSVRELADGLPDARFVVFEESGHFSPLEQQARFREVILEFIGASPAAE